MSLEAPPLRCKDDRSNGGWRLAGLRENICRSPKQISLGNRSRLVLICTLIRIQLFRERRFVLFEFTLLMKFMYAIILYCNSTDIKVHVCVCV